MMSRDRISPLSRSVNEIDVHQPAVWCKKKGRQLVGNLEIASVVGSMTEMNSQKSTFVWLVQLQPRHPNNQVAIFEWGILLYDVEVNDYAEVEMGR